MQLGGLGLQFDLSSQGTASGASRWLWAATLASVDAGHGRWTDGSYMDDERTVDVGGYSYRYQQEIARLPESERYIYSDIEGLHHDLL